jgi:hypothetical protein
MHYSLHNSQLPKNCTIFRTWMVPCGMNMNTSHILRPSKIRFCSPPFQNFRPHLSSVYLLSFAKTTLDSYNVHLLHAGIGFNKINDFKNNKTVSLPTPRPKIVTFVPGYFLFCLDTLIFSGYVAVSNDVLWLWHRLQCDSTSLMKIARNMFYK